MGSGGKDTGVLDRTIDKIGVMYYLLPLISYLGGNATN